MKPSTRLDDRIFASAYPGGGQLMKKQQNKGMAVPGRSALYRHFSL
ncbi:hypothetical protein [Paenibacillus sp. ISL-20]|nr:hypothetical protein [Paenibacillus sp. ISL-20]